MKKIFLSILLLAFIPILIISAPDQNKWDQITMGITSIPGNSTNLTTAISSNMTFQTGPSACRVFFTSQAVTGSTNAVGNMVVHFATSPDGTTFDTAVVNNTFITNNTFKIGITVQSTNSQTVSDWFNVSGVRAIRVQRIENTFPQANTNFVIKVGYPTQ